MSEEKITIPMWFFKFLGWASCLFLGVFIPWAGWMSHSNIRLQTQMESWINSVEDFDTSRHMLWDHEQRLNNLEMQ